MKKCRTGKINKQTSNEANRQDHSSWMKMMMMMMMIVGY